MSNKNSIRNRALAKLAGLEPKKGTSKGMRDYYWDLQTNSIQRRRYIDAAPELLEPNPIMVKPKLTRAEKKAIKLKKDQ